MNDHHHEGCPHDHEGDVCMVEPVLEGSGEADAAPSAETVQIAADAAVQIAEIEADTERERIAAELEHHQISADANAESEALSAETSLEHHEIEAESSDELEETVEDLGEAVEELAETLEGESEPAVDDEPGDESDESGDESEEETVGEGAVSVAPPPRVTPPRAPVRSTRRRGLKMGRH